MSQEIDIYVHFDTLNFFNDHFTTFKLKYGKT